MTMMNICVLQKDDTLWCGRAHVSDIPKFVPVLKPEMATVDDLFAKINASRYPWNFNFYRGAKVTRHKPTKKDFGFYQTGGRPIDYVTVGDIEDEAPEGNLFIDLINKKVVHLALSSPESDNFPVERVWVYKTGSPHAARKVQDCEDAGGTYGDCIDKHKRSSRKPPRGFRMIPLKLDWIPPNDEYRRTNDAAINDLISQLQTCNHPSKEFYRSLGGCL